MIRSVRHLVLVAAAFAVTCLASLASAAPAWRVGVTDQHLKGNSWTTLESPYAEAFEKAGCVMFVIPCSTNAAVIDAQLANLDCVVLSGGADVEPSRYRAKRSPNCGASDLVRDEFEFTVIAAARRRRLPIVGICRGIQIMNVAFGGTLWQDLPSEFPQKAKVCHGSGEYLNPAAYPAAHTVRPEPGTRFAAVVGTADLAVNSHHHQAVRDLAPGFRVAAKSPDGVIEAIESTDYPAFGVQFHPEALVGRAEGSAAYDYPRLLKLLKSLSELTASSR